MKTSLNDHAQVFISYSHQDKRHLERLSVHLEPYRRVGIAIWDDTMMRAGQLWQEEIRKALAAAKVAILLVSADFLASKFIAENELPPLLKAAFEKGTVILPVVIGACNFSETPLAQFQAVNSPTKPLNSMSTPKRETVWTSVAKTAVDALVGPLYAKQVQDVEGMCPGTCGLW